MEEASIDFIKGPSLGRSYHRGLQECAEQHCEASPSGHWGNGPLMSSDALCSERRGGDALFHHGNRLHILCPRKTLTILVPNISVRSQRLTPPRISVTRSYVAAIYVSWSRQKSCAVANLLWIDCLSGLFLAMADPRHKALHLCCLHTFATMSNKILPSCSIR